MEQLITGAIAAGFALAGLFFFRFWHQTRDRYFLFFAGSFWLEALNRVALALSTHADEHEPLYYAVRLVSYGLILAAIWQKNRRRPPRQR
jgi:hypothetical protein